MSKVIVLGSLNMDLVIETNRLPEMGETIMGGDMNYMVGGKGANQAVAAKRVGSTVHFLGKVGEDTFGEKLLKHLKSEGVATTQVLKEKSAFTGIASIYKLPEDNAIVVVGGANDLVDATYTNEALAQVFEEDNLFLTQLEIPNEAVLAGLKLAKEKGGRTILNPAPYNDGVKELLPYVDIITPNETEFWGVVGKKGNHDAIEEEMLAFSLQYPGQLIVTRGAKGVSYVVEGQVVTYRSLPVTVKDTTGAGDTFNGILAARLASGDQLFEAIKLATIGASLAVEALGAQTGMPTLAEIKSKIVE